MKVEAGNGLGNLGSIGRQGSLPFDQRSKGSLLCWPTLPSLANTILIYFQGFQITGKGNENQPINEWNGKRGRTSRSKEELRSDRELARPSINWQVRVPVAIHLAKADFPSFDWEVRPGLMVATPSGRSPAFRLIGKAN